MTIGHLEDGWDTRRDEVAGLVIGEIARDYQGSEASIEHLEVLGLRISSVGEDRLAGTSSRASACRSRCGTVGSRG